MNLRRYSQKNKYLLLILFFIILIILIFSKTIFTYLSNIFQEDEKIILLEVITDDCKLKITTTKRVLFLNTDYLSYQIACPQSLLNQISPSGNYLAYQDLSGGIDNALKLYSIEHSDLISLDNYGTSTIFDLIFLPNDLMAILNGYQGLYNEQYLRVYDLDGLFKLFPANINKDYHNFINLNEYIKVINLPDIGKDYRFLSVANNTIRIHGVGGIQSEVLYQYTLD